MDIRNSQNKANFLAYYKDWIPQKAKKAIKAKLHTIFDDMFVMQRILVMENSMKK